MQCLECERENRPDAKFCAGCGVRLERVCGHCKAPLPGDALFCDACGTAVENVGFENKPKQQVARKTAAERRQVTVMFCDLVGSTELSERLDPEELRELLTRYQEVCGDVVNRLDGHIAKYMGDGILVYFGYPRAHEDDAYRALRAGLGIVAAFQDPQATIAPPGVDLSVRVGITTGLVVAGDVGSGERIEENAIVGETPNIAARLQSLAEPNTVVVGDATRRLVEGLFELDALGPRTLKGISRPVGVYRVREERGSLDRSQGRTRLRMTPLVGRAEEIGMLLKRWAQAKEGEAQVVLLSGEAGIGKSRMVRDLQERLNDELRNRVLYFCSPFHRNSAFYPVVDQLERALRFVNHDTTQQKLDKLETVLHTLRLPKEQFAPVLASLLSLSPLAGHGAPSLSPEELKKKLQETLMAIVAAMAQRDPIFMVVEDAHWIDPSTLDLIGLLIERLRKDRFFLLVTFRPEFQSPWEDYSHVTTLRLNHLTRKESMAMLAKVADDKSLPDEVRDRIVAETDGVPLYVEELTKTVIESGMLRESDGRYVLTGTLGELSIPTSLQDSLMERLDRLGPTKDVVQLASVIGRSFSHELLAAITPLSADELDQALHGLIESNLIYRRGLPSHVGYEFKHALVRDAAYESLLKTTRQKYHRRIAQALEEHFPDTAVTEPEILAYHFETAGDAGSALAYWQRSGELASRRSANAEAVSHFNRGLQLLERQQASRERDVTELKLRVGLGPALLAIKGFSAHEVVDTYIRSRELCDKIGETAHRFPVTWGLWFTKLHTGEIDEACMLAEELLVFAGQQLDDGLLLEAHHAAWTSRFTCDELRPVLEHIEKGMALYDFDKHRSYAFLYGGHDPGVCARIIGALTLCLLGHLDRARDLAAEGVALANKLGHPFTLALALSFSTSVFLFRREPRLVAAQAETLSALCAKEGFPHFSAMADMLQGWALAKQGQTNEGISRMQVGLDAVRQAGVQRLSFQLVILADAYCFVDQIEKGLDVVNEALDVVERTGERRWESEAHRLKGELLLAMASTEAAAAENIFKRAIEISRQQEARLFELRSVTSLSRLWRGQGKRRESREQLAPIYDWFAEGHDTGDLMDAKTLLADLVP